MTYKVTAKLRPILSDVLGKPVFAKNNKMELGKIIEYNPETGDCVLEIPEAMYAEIMKQDFTISSRNTDVL